MNSKITPEQAADYKTALDKFVKDKLYPALPYDTSTAEIVFENVLECPGVPKETIFKRIREWCELEYGDKAPALRYEDLETGKIVAKAFMPVKYVRTAPKLFGGEAREDAAAVCEYTLAFTVRDDKFKVIMQQLHYGITEAGGIRDSAYIPPQRSDYYFGDVFPIVRMHPGVRRGMLELVRNSLTQYDASREELLRYVKAWEKDQKF